MGRGGGGGGGGGRIPHFNWSIYRGGNFLFSFFFFFEPGVKLDEKSIENGLEGQKFLVVRLFWGGCHRPNRYNDDDKLDTIRSFTKIQARTGHKAIRHSYRVWIAEEKSDSCS